MDAASGVFNGLCKKMDGTHCSHRLQSVDGTLANEAAGTSAGRTAPHINATITTQSTIWKAYVATWRYCFGAPGRMTDDGQCFAKAFESCADVFSAWLSASGQF